MSSGVIAGEYTTIQCLRLRIKCGYRPWDRKHGSRPPLPLHRNRDRALGGPAVESQSPRLCLKELELHKTSAIWFVQTQAIVLLHHEAR